MQDRALIPFTNEHFAAYCLKMVGQPYWYGTCGYKATYDLLSRKKKQYPSHYSSARMYRFEQDIACKKVVCDCIGGAKGYAWSGGGEALLHAVGKDQRILSRYGSHRCPDKGANGMFAYCKSKGLLWGSIDTLPPVAGLALHKDGHVGYTVGKGFAVEWRSFRDGCIKTDISSNRWTSWFQLPFLHYDDVPAEENSLSHPFPLGERLLKRGMQGKDVEALQKSLRELGYPIRAESLGTMDFDTCQSLRAFQKKNGLKADGVYGPLTHRALMDAAGDQEEEKPSPLLPPSKTVTVFSGGGRINIRNGNGLEFDRITAVEPGCTFPHIATAANGWHAVFIHGQAGWVSGQFSMLSE